MNKKMIRDPVLYIAPIIVSFLFAILEASVGYFYLRMSFREITFLVAVSIIGIFGTMFLYAMLSNTEHAIESEIARDTRRRMRARGWKPPRR